VPGNVVTWIIDRNSNTTNVCIANCKFCNFYRRPGHGIVHHHHRGIQTKNRRDLRPRRRTTAAAGRPPPRSGPDFYADLFRQLKERYPNLKLHALGPPEIAHISQTGRYAPLRRAQSPDERGLDSLPGAGAEILDDRVRRLISKGKCGGQEWLDVMRAAHQLRLTTSGTMMFGHIETNLERMEHFAALRQVQSEKPADAKGFWPLSPGLSRTKTPS
jgi:cyclic dehypoxanthinyl futalosine synthase